jgi:GAF domain-containing protein
VVGDTLKDDRFKNYPLVVGGPKVRFYAAVPLMTPEGQRAGVFAIADTKPRPEGLTLQEKDALKDMASWVVFNMIVNAPDDEKTNGGVPHEIWT